MSIYTLKIRIANLKDYNINIDKCNEENLLLPKTLLNINNINNNQIKISETQKKEITNPNLFISYNQYPYYDIDKLENNITTFSNKNSLNNPIVNIFSTYDISDTNLKDFSKFLEDKYTKSTDNQSTEKIAAMKKKVIENIKKFVSSEKSSDIIDINKYITFYNIDFLLKNYIFKKSDRTILKLYENNNSNLLNYLVTGFEYIVPTSNNNQNFKIITDKNKPEIVLSIKLNLKKEITTNQLVIKLSLRGDVTTLKNTKSQREINFKKKLNEKLQQEESFMVDNEDDEKKEERKNKIKNDLEKSVNSSSFEEYIEFEPRDISNSYKSYKDIFLNVNYVLNERIFNNYIFKNNVKDIPKIFFDISENNNFKNYLNIEKLKQNQLIKDKKSINLNIELKNLNINTNFISPSNSTGKLDTKNILYEDIIKNITNEISGNKLEPEILDNYIVSLPNNIKIILDNILKKKIYIDGKEYNIIRKIFNYDKNNNLEFEFHRSISPVNNKIDNVYQVIITLYLLDGKKKNNLYNRQKAICKTNNDYLIDNFNDSDFSGNKLIQNYLEYKRNKLTAGNLSMKSNITYKFKKHKNNKTIKNKFKLQKKYPKKSKFLNKKIKKTIKHKKISIKNKTFKESIKSKKYKK